MKLLRYCQWKLGESFQPTCETIRSADEALHSATNCERSIWPDEDCMTSLLRACAHIDYLSHLTSSLRVKLEVLGVRQAIGPSGQSDPALGTALEHLLLQASNMS